MRLNECFDQEIYDMGLKKRRMELDGNVEGLMVGNTLITDSRLGAYRDNSITCHEIEHRRTYERNLMYAPRALQDKVEAFVNRQTVFRLVPLDALLFLFHSGAREASEFAEALEVDEEFFCHAIELYNGIYGGACIKNGCVMTFSPFNVKKTAALK